jgi:hypothetical protein
MFLGHLKIKHTTNVQNKLERSIPAMCQHNCQYYDLSGCPSEITFIVEHFCIQTGNAVTENQVLI